MKRVLNFLFAILLISSFACAQNIDAKVNDALNTTSMPTDEEIMQTLEKFNFSQSQKEQLFKETKKQLQEMYSTKDASKLLEAVKQYPEMEAIMPEQQTQPKRVKKYTNHDPLTRRSKQN